MMQSHAGAEVWGLDTLTYADVCRRKLTYAVVQSHAGAEVWGLDTHPTQSTFATGGEDATVRVYKVSSRKASMVRELQRGVKAVAYNKDGSFLAAGQVHNPKP